MSGNSEPSPVLKDLEEWGFPVRAAVVIRHAERPSLRGVPPDVEVSLTPRGHELAYALGRRFGRYAYVRTFHSPALRCEQTALGITRGALEVGARSTDPRPEDVLGSSPFVDQDRARVQHLTDEFVRPWFSGQFDPTLVKPLEVTAREHRDLVARLLVEAGEGPRLDVLVTHDLNLLIVLKGLLGLRYEELGFLGFLDGVVFRADGGEALARYRDHIRSVGRLAQG